ncbi:NAD(P)H-binding protein, partial [bacterium]|nr:NAD(P)H-binding protein [bacterium]
MIVITGATGNTGSVAAHKLLDQGEKVRVFGRSVERMKPFEKKGADAMVGDIANPDDLRDAFEGAETVYAMVPPAYDSTDPIGYHHSVGLALQKALQDSDVTHVVFLSSIGADLPEGLGPVSGLHQVEQHLNGLEEINTLFVRAGYFME